ncbi:MAG TPA: aminopeptidase P family protein [Azospirillaceae bacterium]|nr:aminopeptidase P family protein [Azospirillaceae bacterium]
MDSSQTSYRGDDHLARLLAEAGIERSVADMRGLLAGVAAAPAGVDPDRWMVLLGRPVTGELADQLRALKTHLAPKAPPEEGDHARRVSDLRAELRRRGLDGFVVPRGDEHQGEYVPLRAERLAWITGFTGSAGAAVVLLDRAAIFVDGRYTLQVRQQVDEAVYGIEHLIETFHGDWAARNLPRGAKLGFDPWMHTVSWVERMRAVLAPAGVELVAVPDNPIDAVWSDQPPAPLGPVVPHELRYAGKASSDKRAEIAAELKKRGENAAVLTQPDSIAWLLNIRGSDVPSTPLPLSFATITDEGEVDLFVDGRKLAPGIESHLGNQVAVRPAEELGAALDELGRAGRRVRVDPGTAAAWIFDRLGRAGAKVEREADPCMLPKAAKNSVELEGARASHRRDGAAMARFLSWLSVEAPKGKLTEIDASDRLLDIRRQGELFRDISFDSISGAGPNGAVVHYRATPKTNRTIENNSVYLIDSGGQYLDGTTDITRTVAVGTPPAEAKRHFTLVLKGHIALSRALFPKGTTGSQLDVLARQFLWQEGLDYDHGTGHGVGSFLSVHEGPARIAKMPNSVALLPGMILSNEPGFYKTGAYGIRIENLIAVRPAEELGNAPADPQITLYGFETLTLCPIDLALVEPDLLDAHERAWLNAYHARVRGALAPQLSGAEQEWLERATAAV